MNDTKDKADKDIWQPQWHWPMGNRYGKRPTLAKRNEVLKALTFEGIRVEPMTTSLGAEIYDIDLEKPLSEQTRQSLVSALSNYRLIVFREQNLSPEALYAFAAQLSEPHINAFRDFAKAKKITDLVIHDEEHNSVENVWHIDETWRDVPPWVTVLQLQDCPHGGNTLFCDLQSVYEGMDPELKNMLENVYCEYDQRCWLTQPMFQHFDAKEILKKSPPVQHPIFINHPITGARQLYFSPAFLSKFVGLPDGVSQDEIVMRLLLEIATPEYQCRMSWRAGDIVLFDNYANIHYASFDYWPQKRTVDRMGLKLPSEYREGVREKSRAGVLGR